MRINEDKLKYASFSGLSTTSLKQELAVARAIIDRLEYGESSNVWLYWSEVPSEHFSELKRFDLYVKIIEIVGRFERLKLLNSTDFSNSLPRNLIILDVNETELKKYTNLLEKEIKQKQLSTNRDFCHLKGNTFTMRLSDGSLESISLTDVEGKNNMRDLFEILFEHWNQFGETANSWTVNVMTKEEIKNALAKKGRREITDKWIKDTVSNIRRVKIKPSRLKGSIEIIYNKEVAGYGLKIKCL